MLRALTPDDVRSRLSAPDLPEVLGLLGFSDADARDGLAMARRIVQDGQALATIAERSQKLLARLGDLTREQNDHVWARDGKRAGEGEIALATFLATVPEVRAYHQGRGIADAVSWHSLADLGHQVAVHRLTFGEFGVHTHDWLVNAWTGRLYWLGRLQYTIEAIEGEIYASTHIPRVGSFKPEAVDASFARVQPFFARHFPELKVRGLHCYSWMLDPQLLSALGERSNVANFCGRWELADTKTIADADVAFFVFSVRGEPGEADIASLGIDIDSLPTDTSLQRAVVAKWKQGGHWFCRTGFLPFPASTAAAPPSRRPGDGASSTPADVSSISGSDPEALVRGFHEVFNVPLYDGAPQVDSDRVPMRMALIAEEFSELVGAVYGEPAEKITERAFTRAVGLDDGTRDVVATADALGDLVYVLYGMALECGIPLPDVLAEIHDSNLSKLGADGKPLLREDGKVLKGPSYHRPDIEAVLVQAQLRH